MSTIRLKGNYLKFMVYLVVIILVNIVAVTLFFRVDLTRNGIYSLSDASRDVVRTLSEPLSIKVFFSKNLPAPHNNTERYLHDIMEEYSQEGGRFFNYSFYDVTAGEAGLTEKADTNRQLAEDYGITPVQIRIIENDEMKLQQAYMGLVIIHGDMIEKIPAITTTDGLEYQLTTAIQKLNNKVSALMRLTSKVKVTLYLSSSLETVAPLMGLNQLKGIPDAVRKLVDSVNAKNMNAMEFEYVDPSKTGNMEELTSKYGLMGLTWPQVPQKNIAAGSGCSGIVISFEDKTETLPLISRINLPIIGTTYQMADPDALEENLMGVMERMIGINEAIGYLADHGTHPLMPGGMGMMPGQQGSNMNAFNQLVSRRYSIKDVSLKDGGIPKGLSSLVVAGPTEKFSDYELFQIDQAIMQGTNVAFFLDTFNEIAPQQGGFGGGPAYVPVDTGLEKLLRHYGVSVTPSYVLDESCYKQAVQGRSGPEERKIYFAPMIDESTINNDPGYMNNIKGLVAMKISPLEADAETLQKSGVSAVKLFSSSDKAWEMKGAINLNPMFLKPPAEDSEKRSYPLAYMLQGEFTSFFDGKEIPVKETDEKDVPPESGTPESGNPEGLSAIKADNAFIRKGKSGSIFVMACSEMLQDTMLDPEGKTTNATFILNVIDHLNNRDDIALMRSKNQSLNPLQETTPVVRNIIKGFNIVVLPILVVFFGLIVWMRRQTKKRQIKRLFQGSREE